MAYKDSLLGYVARRHTTGLEDAATDALCFILSRSDSASDSARRSLSEFLGDDGGPLPIAKAQPWQTDAHGAVPDLACLDGDDNLMALIESKFWAGLTAHQPVTYWEEASVRQAGRAPVPGAGVSRRRRLVVGRVW